MVSIVFMYCELSKFLEIKFFLHFLHNISSAIDCVWGLWSTWSECSVSCGGGTTTRSRTKLTEAENGGVDCSGSYSDSQSCNTDDCPTKGEFTNIFWCHLQVMAFSLSISLFFIIIWYPIKVWKEAVKPWHVSQCPLLNSKKEKRESLDACKNLCQMTSGCTAIDFNSKSRHCWVFGCTVGLPAPQWNNKKMKGYSYTEEGKKLQIITLKVFALLYIKWSSTNIYLLLSRRVKMPFKDGVSVFVKRGYEKHSLNAQPDIWSIQMITIPICVGAGCKKSSSCIF